MNADDVRQQLAHAAYDAGFHAPPLALINALLPTVLALAAAELELAAVLTVPSEDTSEEVREALFRRADTLRADALAPADDRETT